MSSQVNCPSYWTLRRERATEAAALMRNTPSSYVLFHSIDSLNKHDNIEITNAAPSGNSCASKMADSCMTDVTYSSDAWDLNAYDHSYCDSSDDETSAYDSSESDSDDDIPTDHTDVPKLAGLLADWATQFCVSLAALSVLLKILQKFHPELPADARTLLKTPTRSNVIYLPGGGQYLHIGLKQGIEKLYRKHRFSFGDVINLQFNVDGLPLFKSSSTALWPILCIVKCISVCKPFVVGMFCGESKPKDVNAFLSPFIGELKEMITNGVEVCNNRLQVAVHSFVCDAPARAMLQNSKSHGGYFGCGKCVQEGEWHGKVTFQETNSAARTDAQFDELMDEDHHLGPSPLSSLQIGMVSCFPFDYMHLVCLGVMRRLILCWINGPLNTRLCASSIAVLSDRLLQLREFIPHEFCRKPRSLTEILRWKATEFRQFLLYTGPVILWKVLPEPLYQNYLLLFVGITILASPHHCHDKSGYAKQILVTCVENMKVLYGKGMIVYNVHGLIHLSEDVDKFGCVDNFSAFPFENFLKGLKKLVRKPSYVLQQIARRLAEKHDCESNLSSVENTEDLMKEHHSGPMPVGYHQMKQYKQCKFGQLLISLSPGDNCVCHVDRYPCIVSNILSNGYETYIVVKKFRECENFFDYPLHSSYLNIFKVSHLNSVYEVLPITAVLNKCVCLPLPSSAKDCFVVVPLVHSDSLC